MVQVASLPDTLAADVNEDTARAYEFAKVFIENAELDVNVRSDFMNIGKKMNTTGVAFYLPDRKGTTLDDNGLRIAKKYKEEVFTVHYFRRLGYHGSEIIERADLFTCLREVFKNKGFKLDYSNDKISAFEDGVEWDNYYEFAETVSLANKVIDGYLNLPMK